MLRSRYGRIRDNLFFVFGLFRLRIVLLVVIFLFFVASFPTTWLLMLFLGSFELGLSYWGALPGGILISLLLSSGASSATSYYRPVV